MISATSFLYMNRVIIISYKFQDFVELENLLNGEYPKFEKVRKENLGLEVLELNESETSCEKAKYNFSLKKQQIPK